MNLPSALLAIAGCVGAALTGCAPSPPLPKLSGTVSVGIWPPPPGGGDASSAPKETADALTDARLAAAIRARLSEDPALQDSPLEIDVAQGSVTLAGVVPSLLSRDRALEAARQLKGARELVSRISVSPSRVPDEQLSRTIAAAFAADPATRSSKANVVVLNGVVTLNGAVDSQARRALLAEVLERVPGVRAIDDDLAVPAKVQRPERDTAAEVHDALDDDGLLDGASVSAEVKGRDVSLVGVVGTLAQRERALRDASVSGVDHVDARRLRVEWRENERNRRARNPAVATDAHLADAVKRVLARDPMVSGRLPSVAANGGTVTLGGAMDGLRATRAAAMDAARVRGVASVADEMSVVPANRESDAAIEKRVQETVLNDPSAESSPSLRMTTQNGRVVLTGNVRSSAEKGFIESDVESVSGVLAVEDDLRITGDGSPLSTSAVEALRARAREDIFWDARVDTGQVNVEASPAGVVTLTGTVATPEQVKAATQDAIRAGAASVVSRLQVNTAGT